MPVETQVENKYLEFKKSGIHNYGAFAVKPVRKGTRIIEYVGRPLTKKKAQAALQDGNAYVFTINKHFDIDGEVPWNPARFINHGCEVNAESCLLYTSPSPRDKRQSRMPSSA